MPIPPYNGPQYQYMGPNAYGPYPTVPMQPTFQATPTQTQPQQPSQFTSLPGRVIKPNETVTPQEVPMDGTASVTRAPRRATAPISPAVAEIFRKKV